MSSAMSAYKRYSNRLNFHLLCMGAHFIYMLFVFIYVYWCSTTNPIGAPEFTPFLVKFVLLIVCPFSLLCCLSFFHLRFLIGICKLFLCLIWIMILHFSCIMLSIYIMMFALFLFILIIFYTHFDILIAWSHLINCI